MSTVTYFITGASRGLGLELATQLLASSPNVRVVATARNPANSPLLDAVVKANEGRIHVLKVDVSNEDSVKSAVAELEASSFVPNGVDVLINNAGTIAGGHSPISQATTSDFLENIQTNLFGVAYTTLALLPLLRKGNKKQIFAISSALGSLQLGFVEQYSSFAPLAGTYSVSKAAVNQWLLKLSHELKGEGFTVIPFHPGYVSTDMNGGQGELTPRESVSQILSNVVFKVTFEDNAKFLSYTGDVLPW